TPFEEFRSSIPTDVEARDPLGWQLFPESDARAGRGVQQPQHADQGQGFVCSERLSHRLGRSRFRERVVLLGHGLLLPFRLRRRVHPTYDASTILAVRGSRKTSEWVSENARCRKLGE